MDGVVHLWTEWEVQILVLFSFALQLSLLMFAWMRRRNISAVPRTLLWLAYLLADSTAIYILGHMSINCQPREHRELMAFWAPFLLVHLGGQDTITAYAMEDNQLWPRHLLSLITQAAGAAYVMYKYMAGSGTLVVAAVLIFVAGVVKYGERIWALKSSNLDNLRMFLNNVEKPKLSSEVEHGEEMLNMERTCRVRLRSRTCRVRLNNVVICCQIEGGDSEEVLQDSHYLLPICMGQFVDYKFWPSPLQSEALKLLFADKHRAYELIEMQLSLMHDVLYTKALAIHTWYGCFVHAISSAATVAAFFLFKSSSGKENLNRVDVVVTYTLLAGALLIEMASLLRAMGSTWTCALLRARGWHRLHSTFACVRQFVKAAERIRRWPGSIGQHNLHKKYVVGESHGSVVQRVSRLVWTPSSFTIISADTKKLVLEEIERMVGACEGNESTMRRCRGQCAMKPYEGFIGDFTVTDFDDSILEWHFATAIMLLILQTGQDQQEKIVEAIEALSNYMMFLLQERPYMLPSPARSVLYASPIKADVGSRRDLQKIIQDIKDGKYGEVVPSFARGAELAERLLELKVPLEVVLGVWVEMLCYAAHHCSRDSHARQLNSGGEFITVVWILTTALFNRSYCDKPWFEERMRNFFRPRPRGARQLSLLQLAMAMVGSLLCILCIFPLVPVAGAMAMVGSLLCILCYFPLVLLLIAMAMVGLPVLLCIFPLVLMVRACQVLAHWCPCLCICISPLLLVVQACLALGRWLIVSNNLAMFKSN